MVDTGAGAFVIHTHTGGHPPFDLIGWLGRCTLHTCLVGFQRKMPARTVTGSADMQGACGAWLVLPSNHFKGCFLSGPWIARSRKSRNEFHETTAFGKLKKLDEDRASKMFYLIGLALVCSTWTERKN